MIKRKPPKPLNFQRIHRLDMYDYPTKRAYHAALRADAKEISRLIDRRFSWAHTKRPDAFAMACDVLAIYSHNTRWRTSSSSVSLDPHAMAELLAKNKSSKAVREALRVAIVNAALAIE